MELEQVLEKRRNSMEDEDIYESSEFADARKRTPRVYRSSWTCYPKFHMWGDEGEVARRNTYPGVGHVEQLRRRLEGDFAAGEEQECTPRVAPQIQRCRSDIPQRQGRRTDSAIVPKRLEACLDEADLAAGTPRRVELSPSGQRPAAEADAVVGGTPAEPYQETQSSFCGTSPDHASDMTRDFTQCTSKGSDTGSAHEAISGGATLRSRILDHVATPARKRSAPSTDSELCVYRDSCQAESARGRFCTPCTPAQMSVRSSDTSMVDDTAAAARKRSEANSSGTKTRASDACGLLVWACLQRDSCGDDPLVSFRTPRPPKSLTDFYLDQRVKFWSATFKEWLPTRITDIHPNGAVKVAVKKGAWISPRDQLEKIQLRGDPSLVGKFGAEPTSFGGKLNQFFIHAHTYFDDSSRSAGMPNASRRWHESDTGSASVDQLTFFVPRLHGGIRPLPQRCCS